jgi:hypothetical protein
MLIQLAFCLSLISIFIVNADHIPSTAVTGPVPVVTSSSQSAFDGPKTGAVNATSFDWWYFDAATSDGGTAVAIIFFRSTQTLFAPEPSVDYIEVSVLWPNGTTFDQSFPASFSSVTTQGFGASGTWNGVGSFEGSADLQQYTVTLNTEVICGTLAIHSIAPAHYPNGEPPGSVASTVLAPTIGWVNAIPAGVASCDFKIAGDSVAFHGIGYHDQNWGGLELQTCVESWYWGRGTVGPYSLVWFVVISGITGEQYSSAYLVNDGKVEVANLNTPHTTRVSMTVLPTGNGTQYPPSAEDNLPTGFLIEFNGATGEKWSFSAEAVHIALDNSEGGPDGYTRWAGTVSGGQKGGSVATGSGVWEWLRFY